MDLKTCNCGRALPATITCGLCQDSFCKKCVEFLPQETFSFFDPIPKDLSHAHYCLSCYGARIVPALLEYNGIMKRAAQVLILDKPQRRPLNILKKCETPLKVKDCRDRDETVLRLAFKASELGFNSIIKADISYTKVRNEGYQKMIWHGTGFAAELDARNLD